MYLGAKSVYYKRFIGVLLLGVLIVCGLVFSPKTHAVAGINQQLNFQGRLLNSQGATVPDGYYNMQFKIYQDGDGQSVGDTTGTPAGTLKWTESYLNANSQGVMVKNGYMSVNLGSITPFGSSVDWNQNTLWLSVNIGTTNTTCTPFTSCSPDGEMVPMKRLSSTPYALNSGLLGGLNSSQFLQLAQGVQTDVSTNTNSIYINKTGTGNIIDLQANGTDAFMVSNTGNLTFGNNINHILSVATAAVGVAGNSLTISSGAGGAGGAGLAGGNLLLQGGTAGGTNSNGGNVIIDAGALSGTGTDGSINIGTSHASTIQIGSTTLASGVQNVNVGNNNTPGSTTNVTIGSGSSATTGTTTIQSKGNVNVTSSNGNVGVTASAGTTSINSSGNLSLTSTAGTIALSSNANTTLSTNNVVRATLDTANAIYFGNGVVASTPNNFTISGTGSATTAVAGGTVIIQGGNATVGNANGGNLTLSGGSGIGTGVNGLVVMSTPTFSTTANDPNCYTGGALVASSCTIAVASVNNSAAILAGFSVTGQTASLPNPTTTTAGRVVYITAANGSSDFTLSVNGGGTGNTIAMRQNTTATMIWNGSAWTAAGASSSTTLQSAYDNTLQSAGGAELVVSHTGNTNGLTIRDSSINPVNGTLLSVQTTSAAGLFSVNSNVTEYSSDSGAETAGGTSSTFPANTWSNNGSATVSRYTTAGGNIATGQASVSVVTTTAANDGVKNNLNTTLTPNMHYNVSFTARLSSGTFTDMNVYYSVDSTTASVACTASQAIITSVWTKVNCTFAAPSSGLTSSNAILIRQTGGGTARTFYIDNLSVTIAADYNLATDGGVDDSTNFATNWSFVSATSGAGSVFRNTADGNDASDSAGVTLTTGAANAGIRNRLSMNPLTSTLYRISVYAKLGSGTFTDFKVRYSRDGSTGSSGNYVDCVDYNTQTVTTTGWTQITCYVTTDGTAATNPYVNFVETSSAARTFYVDTFSMTLASNTTPNVQIGGGINGGPVTLLTLDRAASAPIASNNNALLGSMYYDTTLGKLQCYEADGWGACGSSPDNVVTISPEYTNAVMHGTGVGTMTSDICSSTLGINDGSLGQPTICGTNETYNFYKWTSPQASPQTYSIYVTYQLPTTFKTFASGQTSIMGRTDSTYSTVQYQIYRNDSTAGLVPCGSMVSVSTGAVSSWQIGIASGAADPSTCGFIPGNSIVFQINVIASQNANAYVGNLNFIFSNK